MAGVGFCLIIIFQLFRNTRWTKSKRISVLIATPTCSEKFQFDICNAICLYGNLPHDNILYSNVFNCICICGLVHKLIYILKLINVFLIMLFMEYINIFPNRIGVCVVYYHAG